MDMRMTAKTLIVETNSASDAEKLLANTKVQIAFKCEYQRKCRPLMILYDVATNLSGEDLVNTIHQQNFEGVSLADFKEKFILRFKIGPKKQAGP